MGREKELREKKESLHINVLLIIFIFQKNQKDQSYHKYTCTSYQKLTNVSIFS